MALRSLPAPTSASVPSGRREGAGPDRSIADVETFDRPEKPAPGEVAREGTAAARAVHRTGRARPVARGKAPGPAAAVGTADQRQRAASE